MYGHDRDKFTRRSGSRDTLDKVPTKMLDNTRTFVIAKERKSMEDRQTVVEVLHQLMAEVKGDRFSTLRKSI